MYRNEFKQLKIGTHVFWQPYTIQAASPVWEGKVKSIKGDWVQLSQPSGDKVWLPFPCIHLSLEHVMRDRRAMFLPQFAAMTEDREDETKEHAHIVAALYSIGPPPDSPEDTAIPKEEV